MTTDQERSIDRLAKEAGVAIATSVELVETPSGMFAVREDGAVLEISINAEIPPARLHAKGLA